MIAYKVIDFSVLSFLREVIYPVYYFVLGSFDSEIEKLSSNNI